MEKEELHKMILEAATEVDDKKKLSCSKAFALAHVYGISPDDIGSLCNEREIKIVSCQLGCFK